MRISLLTVLLLLSGSLRSDGTFTVDEIVRGIDEDWLQCSRNDEECHDAQELFKMADELPSISQIYELAQSTVSLIHSEEAPTRDFTPTDRMMKIAYLEAKFNFPLVHHFNLMMELKKNGIEIGDQFVTPSDAGRILLSQAEMIHSRPIAGIVKGMLKNKKNPIALIFDLYEEEKFGRIHCFFILQYALGNRPTAMFWKNHIFLKRPKGRDIYEAFVNGLLEDETYLREKMAIHADLPNLFAKNLVAVSIGGASDISEEEKEEIMNGGELSLVALLDIFRQRNDTSQTTIVNLRCRSGGFEPRAQLNLQWYEVECGMLQSHHHALEAFSNTRLQSLTKITDSDLQRVVNASHLFGFSEEESLAAAESYRAFVKALQMTSAYRSLLSEKTSHLMWMELLDTTLSLGFDESFKLLLRHYIAVPFNATYVQLTHSLLTDIVRDQIIPLNQRILNALLVIQINGPPLREFNPRIFADIWFEEGNVASDHETLETSAKMRMAKGEIPRGDDDHDAVNDFDLLLAAEEAEIGEDWKQLISTARKEFSVEKFLTKIDFSFE